LDVSAAGLREVNVALLCVLHLKGGGEDIQIALELPVHGAVSGVITIQCEIRGKKPSG